MDTHVLYMNIGGLTSPELCRSCWFRNMRQALAGYRKLRKEIVRAPKPVVVEETAATET